MTTTQNKRENWEERFDEKFALKVSLSMPIPKGGICEMSTEPIKSFIAAERAKAQEEILKEVTRLAENHSVWVGEDCDVDNIDVIPKNSFMNNIIHLASSLGIELK